MRDRALLEARDVSLSFGAATVLQGVSLAARPGEVLALCGPNGAGKSSLLSILSGEQRPRRGDARLGGTDLASLSPLALARRRVVLEQHPAIDVAFTVRELAALGAAPAGFDAAFEEQAAVDEALEQAGVETLADRAVRTLSGGERHRAHFARVLVQLAAGRAEGGGEAMLLDEPTASLDLAHQATVLRAARAVAAEGAIVVVVLHDLSLAAAFADRIALLADGALDAVGAPADVLTSARLSALYGVDIAVERDASGRPLVRPVFSLFENGDQNVHRDEPVQSRQRL